MPVFDGAVYRYGYSIGSASPWAIEREWFWNPLKANKEVLTDPTIYQINNKDTMEGRRMRESFIQKKIRKCRLDDFYFPVAIILLIV